MFAYPLNKMSISTENDVPYLYGVLLTDLNSFNNQINQNHYSYL